MLDCDTGGTLFYLKEDPCTFAGSVELCSMHICGLFYVWF